MIYVSRTKWCAVFLQILMHLINILRIFNDRNDVNHWKITWKYQKKYFIWRKQNHNDVFDRYFADFFAYSFIYWKTSKRRTFAMFFNGMYLLRLHFIKLQSTSRLWLKCKPMQLSTISYSSMFRIFVVFTAISLHLTKSTSSPD